MAIFDKAEIDTDMNRIRHFSAQHTVRLCVGVCLLAIGTAIGAWAADTGAAADKPTSMRISSSQYRRTITNIFGSSIVITARFEAEERENGLLAIGALNNSVSEDGFERYHDIAKDVAAQVVDKRHRDVLIPCKPKSETAGDEACARKFLATAGRLLFRRPLNKAEIQALVAVSKDTADKKKDFYAGISTSLVDLLISPDFLFRYRNMEPDPAHPGHFRLDSYSKAAIISSFLWNSNPDDLLLKAAENGSLQTDKGLAKQVDRMISSPEIESGVRSFFSDMLGLDQFDILSKDAKFFPRFTPDAKRDAPEQTLRTVVDHVVNRQGDYRDLFTTRHTFMTRALAALYGVPLLETTDNARPMRWLPYTLPEGDPRAGILSQASFVALYSGAGRTSPTIRGKNFRLNILCQIVPPPPPNIDFTLIQDITNPKFKTVRDRLEAHRTNPSCAGCHRLMDPVGLAFENFDSAGGYRTTENGTRIDTSGEWNGVKFRGPVELTKALHDDPAITACVARKVFAFASGAMPPVNSPQWKEVQAKFADSHFNFLQLMRAVAVSDLLYSVPETRVSMLDRKQ
jgi:hypothetical protein